MRSIQEIKDLVAQEHGYEDWHQLWQIAPAQQHEELIAIAMSNYAYEVLSKTGERLGPVQADTDLLKIAHEQAEAICREHIPSPMEEYWKLKKAFFAGCEARQKQIQEATF